MKKKKFYTAPRVSVFTIDKEKNILNSLSISAEFIEDWLDMGELINWESEWIKYN